MNRVSVSKKLGHISLILILMTATFIPIASYVSQQASATTVLYCYSWAPSASESNSWKVYPKYVTGNVPCYAAQVFQDPYSVNLASSATYYYVETGDFTNPYWLGPWDDLEIGGIIPFVVAQKGYMPTENATILSVIVLAKFNSQYPATTLYFSTNDKSSWVQSSSIPAGGGGFLPFYAITWNVTGLATWNHTVLHSDELWVKARFSPVVGLNYYLDYLGFIVMWSDPEESGSEDPLPDPSGSEETDYDSFFMPTNIVGLLGFVGLVGVIAVPALGVYIYRQTDEGRIVVGIKMLAAFMIFLSMFMISLA